MPEAPLLHLLIPKWSGTGVNDVFGHRFPPMALLVLAAHARRAGWDVEVIDLNFERSPLESPIWQGQRTRLGHRHRSGRPDLAALTVWTATAPAAYAIGDAYRDRGVPVVLGGVHPSLLPGEAILHADAVVCGEADRIFPAVLADAVAGTLKPLYQGSFEGMEHVPLNHEWADIYKTWPLTRYAPMNTLQTTRGCRFNCDFCSVIRINGRGARHSPPERVIDEVRVLKHFGQHVGDFAYVFFLDDDLASDLDYCGELCETILRSGEKFVWGCQASIGLARNTELLDLAARSGLRAMFTGFESVSRDSLIECNKKNRPGEFGELIAKIHKRGIAIEGGFIFGFDHDKPDVFRHTAEFVDRIDCDVAHFSILTPYPGTQTFSRMFDEGRITTFDWRRYNLYHVVYEPAQMSAQQLHDGLRQVYRWWYANGRRLRRFGRHALHRDPRFHLTMTAAGWGYHVRYQDPTVAATPEFEAAAEEVARLALTSSAPAQQALDVAYSQATSTVRFLARKGERSVAT